MKPSARPSEPDFFSPQVAKARRFYLNPRHPRRPRLAVVCGGLEHCAPDYQVRRDTFPYYSIEYVVYGQGELRLAGRRHALLPGQLFAYGPRVPHHITASSKESLVKYFVDFVGSDAPALLKHCRLQPGKAARVFPPQTLGALFDELIAAGLHGGRHGRPLCATLLQSLTQKITLAAAPSQEAETLAFATYQHCRAHIEENCLRLGTLEQVAAESTVHTIEARPPSPLPRSVVCQPRRLSGIVRRRSSRSKRQQLAACLTWP
jgi:AraC-like ligand binding domain